VIDAHNLKLTPFPKVTDLMRMLMRTIRNKEAGAVYVKPESGENDRASTRGGLNFMHINIFVCNVTESLAMLTVGGVAEMQGLSDA
jgi:hypothetical protein